MMNKLNLQLSFDSTRNCDGVSSFDKFEYLAVTVALEGKASKSDYFI